MSKKVNDWKKAIDDLHNIHAALSIEIHYNLEDIEKPYTVGYHYINTAGGMNGDSLGDTQTIEEALDLIAASISDLKTLEVHER